MFNVKLESFDASAKPKIIKEVKAMNPTLTLVAVRYHHCNYWRVVELTKTYS